MPSVLEAVKPAVDKTMTRLAATKFTIDPVAGYQLSRITSIVSSAYKRHGAIIEVALFEAISQKNGVDAENKVRFFVYRNASAYVESLNFQKQEGMRPVWKRPFPTG